MPQDYWLKQDPLKPLFPDILWSRPETVHTSGKLLIIGGNAHGFSQVGMAYEAARKAGAGTIRILMPDVLQKTVSILQTSCYFAPSNPSGGFAKQALSEFLEHAAWADAVLFAGEFGRNSETAVVLESFIQKYSGLLTVSRDAVDYFINSDKDLLLDRVNTCLVLSAGQLQKLATHAKARDPIGLSLDLSLFVEALHEFTLEHKAHIITHHQGNTTISTDGKVSSTTTSVGDDIWRTPTAARATVFWLQNSSKPFEAMTSSLAA